MNYENMVAFAIGYYDGRKDGVENNRFEGAMRGFYQQGYDRGVADYCEFDEETDGDYMSDVEADADTLKSVGWGTDEDYE